MRKSDGQTIPMLCEQMMVNCVLGMWQKMGKEWRLFKSERIDFSTTFTWSFLGLLTAPGLTFYGKIVKAWTYLIYLNFLFVRAYLSIGASTVCTSLRCLHSPGSVAASGRQKAQKLGFSSYTIIMKHIRINYYVLVQQLKRCMFAQQWMSMHNYIQVEKHAKIDHYYIDCGRIGSNLGRIGLSRQLWWTTASKLVRKRKVAMYTRHGQRWSKSLVQVPKLSVIASMNLRKIGIQQIHHPLGGASTLSSLMTRTDGMFHVGNMVPIHVW